MVYTHGPGLASGTALSISPHVMISVTAFRGRTFRFHMTVCGAGIQSTSPGEDVVTPPQRRSRRGGHLAQFALLGGGQRAGAGRGRGQQSPGGHRVQVGAAGARAVLGVHVAVEQRPAGKPLGVTPPHAGARAQGVVAVVLVPGTEVLAEHADGIKGADHSDHGARHDVPPVVSVVGDAGQRADERPQQEQPLQPRHQQQRHIGHHPPAEVDHDVERGEHRDGGVAGREGPHRVPHGPLAVPLVGAREVVDPLTGRGAVERRVRPARVEEVGPRLGDEELHGVRHEHDDAQPQEELAVPSGGGAHSRAQRAPQPAAAVSVRQPGLHEPQRKQWEDEAPREEDPDGDGVAIELKVDLRVVAVEAGPRRWHVPVLHGGQ